jgi:hypothetical protein
MPAAYQLDHQLHSSSSHHERTYQLSRQECQEQIKTINFIPTPASMRELTPCQGKNARSRSRPSAPFQLHPIGKNLLPVRLTIPGAGQNHQLHSSSSHHERTYCLSSQECQKQIIEDHQLHSSCSHHERTYSLLRQECQEQIKTITFILAPATKKGLTPCQGKNARSRSRPSASF